MRLTYPRILSAATAVAVVLSTMGMASFASAASGGPTVTLASTTASTTSATTIPVTATFSVDVHGLASTSIAVSNGTVSNFAGVDSNYTFDVTPTANGAVTVSIPADAATGIDAPAKGNQASNVLAFAYTAATTTDVTAPVISNVVITPTSTGAGVTWNTNEAAVGQVFYGTTTSYGHSTTLETTASTTHAATLSGLTASTTYHYQITARDASLNTSATTDATFMTTAAATTTPSAPTISNIAVSGVGTSTATITWNTNLASSTQLFYGTTTGYGHSTTLDTTATSSHSVALSGLTEATLYHFHIVATNGTGSTTSSDQTFFSASTASSTPLAVTSVDAIKTNATADDTYVHGWEWVMHLTVPTNEDAFRMKFSDFAMIGGSSTIPAANNIRLFSAQSANASSEETAVTETNNNYGGWLYLNNDAATSTAGRQIDVHIQVRVPSGTTAGSYTTTYGAQSVPTSATSTTP